MRLRTLLITALLLLAFVVVAFAQAPPAMQQPDALRAKVIKELGLTKDQVTQIRAIVQKYRQDVAAELKSSDPADQKKAKVKDLHDTAANAITALLNDDQKARAEKIHFVQLLLEPRARAEARLIVLLSKLNLTDDQKASIKTINQQAEAAAKAIQADTSLDQPAKRARLQELRKDTQAKIMAVLTPAQREQLKKLMAQEKGRVKGAK